MEIPGQETAIQFFWVYFTFSAIAILIFLYIIAKSKTGE